MADNKNIPAKTLVLLSNGERIKSTLTVQQLRDGMIQFIKEMKAEQLALTLYKIPVPSGIEVLRRIDLIVGLEDFVPSPEENVDDQGINLSTDQE